jgi:hypothetical protein
MKILNVAYPFAPVREETAGGAEQVVRMLDRALMHAGHKSFVIACEGSQVVGELVETYHANGALMPPRNSACGKHTGARSPPPSSAGTRT